MALLHSVRSISRTRLVLGSIAVVLLALFVGRWVIESRSSLPTNTAPTAISVEAATATKRDVPIYLDGLGTVQAFNTVTITPRVDGELQKIGFVEGQLVKPGDFLAQIDPRPYQAALDQAVATKSKDVATLENANRDLARYTMLAPQDFTSKQTVDTQRSLVAQLSAQVKADQASIDNARTQLDYATITSPIQGRTGIRLVDLGNNLHAANATGIVVVTQMQPISVIFTLPEEALLPISQGMKAGPMTVMAMSRDGETVLDQGVVALIDNQIDQTTGTLRLKATFPNTESMLWPGGFVDIRVLQQTEQNALTIPSAAIQRGPNGTFAFVVKPDSTVEMRPLKITEDTGTIAIVASGLQSGETVTTTNEYRLQPGIAVSVATKTTAAQGGGQRDAAP